MFAFSDNLCAIFMTCLHVWAIFKSIYEMFLTSLHFVAILMAFYNMFMRHFYDIFAFLVNLDGVFAFSGNVLTCLHFLAVTCLWHVYVAHHHNLCNSKAP